MFKYFCIRDNGDFKSGCLYTYESDIAYEEHKNFLVPVSSVGHYHLHSCRFICIRNFGTIGSNSIDGNNDNRHLFPIIEGEIIFLIVYGDMSFVICDENGVLNYTKYGAYSQFDECYHHFMPYHVYFAELRDKKIDEILTFS